MDDQTKNLILASVLSVLVLGIWFALFPPKPPAPPAESPSATAQSESASGSQALTPPTSTTPATAAELAANRQEALARTERVRIETPRLDGSISLTGGRIDDLFLKGYRETLDPDSPEVTLLTPVGQPLSYYALFGWAPGADLDFAQVPGAGTEWQIESGGTVGPDTPVTLVWDNGSGLVFRRTIAVDDNYMFTVTQSVENTGTTAQRLAPYGLVARHGHAAGTNFWILHEGVVRMSDGRLEEIKYKSMPDLDPVAREQARASVIDVEANGWIGFTDKYWMTALIPQPGQSFTSVAKYIDQSNIYQTETRLPTMTVEPGATASVTTQLFAGAKEWDVIRAYQNQGIDRFVDSIDWGWFFFLTKPIFWVLHHLHALIGNMGWSIIVLTLVIKALLFPLAFKSYVSMAKMKELQPEMEKLKERAGEDRQKMQQEMMALYKREKVNPASGCLPVLLQIPIFFSLYKVIFVTIELRHAPWIGWIRDLSAPDPSSILNLFGLLPFAAPDHTSMLGLFSLGILPIILGISMWLQQKLNPAPTDPTQAAIFAWMPWIFMFTLGQFASGLILYWIANNTITFLQQYMIMRSHGKAPDIFGNIISGFRRKSGGGNE